MTWPPYAFRWLSMNFLVFEKNATAATDFFSRLRSSERLIFLNPFSMFSL